MQAQTILPVPGASASGTPARGASGTDGSGEQFSQALAREVGQRQSQQAQAAAAHGKPQAPDARQEQAREAATAATASAGDDSGSAAGTPDALADATDATMAAADIAAIAPVTDMLALAAALNPAPPAAMPAAVRAATDAAQALTAPDAIGAAGAVPGQRGAAAIDLATLAAAATAASEAGAASAGSAADQAQVLAARLPQAPGDAGAATHARVQRHGAEAEAPRQAFAALTAAAQLRQPAREDVSAAASDKAPDGAAPVPPASQPLQAARLETNPVAAAPHLPARVGTPAWDHQVGHKIVWMAGAGEQTASLTLNPPDLGPMQIVLAVNDDKASVAFTSAQPEVRQALEAALPRLRDMLGETGISLGEATVSAGTPGDRSPDERTGGARGGPVAGDAPSPAAAVTQRRAAPGLVDTFA